MKRQLYMGGGIMNLSKEGIGGGDFRGIDMGSRAGFGLIKKITGGAKKAVKKVTGGIRDIASSDIGKAALIGAAAFGIPGTQLGGIFGRASFGGAAPGIFGFGGIGNALAAGKAKFFPDPVINLVDEVALTKGVTKSALKSNLLKGGALAGLTAFLTSQYGFTEEEAQEELDDPEKLQSYLRVYYTNLNPNAGSEEIEEFVRVNSATGGRIGFAEGPVLPPDPTQPVNPFGPKPPADAPVLPDRRMASNIENDEILEALFEKYIDLGFSPKDAADKAREEFDKMSMMKLENRGLAAIGGKMDSASDNAMQAAGIEGLPIRQNPKGVKELDLRKTGGFIPPVGIKEKADDIPAMLSNNEFVFTADAVRNAGGGDVNLGAQRMYDTMKRLEAGGKA